MFKKTIEALKAAEAAVQEELNELFVPYNPEDGTGGVHWHAAGAGILGNAAVGLANLRDDLEKRQVRIDEAQAQADAEAKVSSAQTAEAAALAATVQARKLADEQGVDLSQIHGTGEGGKITKADVDAALPPNATDTAIARAAGLGVDLRAIKGTGVDGRITKADVDAAVAKQEAAHA